MFRFRLEKVLKHRSDIVQNEARKLHLIASRLEDIRREIRTIQQQCSEVTEREGQRAHGDEDAGRRVLLSNWVAGQWEFIRQHENRAREVLVALENQRSVLVKAKQDESILQKLKDRHYQQWLLEESRRERRQSDEAAAWMSGRRS